jgi:lysophospholipase L1-like esterase
VPVIIDPTNAALLYSPFNWSVSSGIAASINSGAYIRTIFTGTSVAVTFNTSPNAAPFSQVVARVDNGPWQLFILASGNPTFTVATGLENHKHLFEIRIKSTSETINRWVSSQTVVQITSIVLDASATVQLPHRKSKTLLLYGDSITEGVRIISGDQTDTNNNDNRCCYSSVMLDSIDCEYGIVGFGATGLTQGGTGGVPALGSTYNYIMSGVARVFTPQPDFILLNEGTNDDSATSTTYIANYTTILNALHSVAPNATIMLIVPFNQHRITEIATLVSTFASSKVVSVQTSGFFDNTDSFDGIHPYGAESAGRIAPALLPGVIAVMYPTSSVTANAPREYANASIG